MSCHYIGTTKTGAILKRISTRNDFTVAAVYGEQAPGEIVELRDTNWSTSEGKLAHNSSFRSEVNRRTPIEIVPVRLVDAKAYRAALKPAAVEVKPAAVEAVTVQTYAKKFNAERAAERQGLGREAIERTEAGWIVVQAAPVAAEPELDEVPAFLQADRSAVAAAAIVDEPTIAVYLDSLAAFGPAALEAATAWVEGPESEAVAADFDDLQEIMAVCFAHGYKAALAAGPAARKPRRASLPTNRTESKAQQIAALLLGADGCTSQDILDLTGWKAVSVPQVARNLGVALRQEKAGRVTRYYGAVAA